MQDFFWPSKNESVTFSASTPKLLCWIFKCRCNDISGTWVQKSNSMTKNDLYQEFYSPNILAVASSLVGEDSLSHHIDTSIGVYIIDRYTYHALEFLERVTRDSK